MNVPCPCKDKNNSVLSHQNGGDKAKSNPLACPDCLDKHIGAAAEYAKEAEEDATRLEEYRRAVGHMVCAEDHARALGLFDYASRIRAARKTFQKTRKAPDMESLLSWSGADGEISAGSGANWDGVKGGAVSSGAPEPAFN